MLIKHIQHQFSSNGHPDLRFANVREEPERQRLLGNRFQAVWQPTGLVHLLEAQICKELQKSQA
jgi:hypothetical protein